MTTTITGATGVNQITDDAITAAKLPAGSVLQVLNVVMTTPTAATIDGWYDITPLVLTITPLGGVSNAGWLTAIRIKRGSTLVGATTGLTNNTSGMSYMTANGYGGKTMSTSFLDSPSTTSATTYQVQYYGGNTAVATYIGREGDTAAWGAAPTLTLMEIAG
jgi:hypothetical protein